MKKKEQNSYKCKRCGRPASADLICQNCKNELLTNYEVSSDWQTAFEIERAQLVARRYQSEDVNDDDLYHY